MKRSSDWDRDVGKSSRLSDLLAEARKSRRVGRRVARSAVAAEGMAARRRHAEMLIERMLSGPLPEYVDCSSYLNRLATRRQVASRSIGTMMTSVQGVLLNAVRARALAVAIAELLHFLDVGTSDTPLRVYLAVAVHDDRLVVGLGAEGAMAHVATRDAHLSLLRARSISSALGGDFQRGIDGARMVFGLTFPRSIVEEPS